MFNKPTNTLCSRAFVTLDSKSSFICSFNGDLMIIIRLGLTFWTTLHVA